jgi:hypothetical protein
MAHKVYRESIIEMSEEMSLKREQRLSKRLECG